MRIFGDNLDFLVEVEKGNVSGHSMVHKFGRNDGVPSGTWEFISLLGHTVWPLSSDTLVRVKAGNALDTSTGTGAREITIQGITTGFLEATTTLTTAGATASTYSATSFWRVYRAWVSSVGTYGGANSSEAVIIENSAGGTDIIQIGAEEGQTQFAGWTVPVNKTAYLLGAHIHVDTNKTADIRLFTRDDIDDTVAPMKSKRLKLYLDGVEGNFMYDPSGPEVKINQKSDIWFEALGDGAVSEVSCDFELLVVDNNV